MSTPRRVALEPAYLLHHRDYSDSSRIVELLTRGHGRVSLFARGVRRQKSRLRGVLQPFTPLLASWTGGPEGGQLTGAELAAEAVPLPSARLMSAFYLNELLLRLTPRGDAVPEVFEAYAIALEELRSGASEAPALRHFELDLLEHLGYGVDVAAEAGGGEPLATDRYYHFRPGVGAYAVEDTGDREGAYLGRHLLALARRRLEEPDVLRAARRLLRDALDHCLEGRGLRSREVMLALRRKEAEK